MKKLFYISFISFMFFILLIGCRSKKESFESQTIKDSIVTKSFEYVSQPISTQITIDQICDTLTGKLRNFNQVESSGQNQANVSTKDNKLFIDLFTGLSQRKNEDTYSGKEKIVVKKVEVIKYRVPTWSWMLHIASLVFLLIVLYLIFRPKLPF